MNQDLLNILGELINRWDARWDSIDGTMNLTESISLIRDIVEEERYASI